MICLSNLRQAQAADFCQQNNLPLIKKRDQQFDLLLIFHADLVELYDTQLNTAVSIDFLHGQLAHRHQFGGGRGQAIARAIGLKSGITASVLDVTAGLAGDAFVLATLGCPVTMIERSAVLACLIEDAIERATLNTDFQAILDQGFNLIHEDANDYMMRQQGSENKPPDVIYIDPMYPERKKSALVKKEMQILQRLHGQDDNAGRLLDNALTLAKKRVVVKRPIQAGTVNEKKPNTCIKSKKTRYDIYTIEKM